MTQTASKGQDFEAVAAHSPQAVAEFNDHHSSLLNRVQHRLHQTPALVPLIVLVLSIAVFGALLGSNPGQAVLATVTAGAFGAGFRPLAKGGQKGAGDRIEREIGIRIIGGFQDFFAGRRATGQAATGRRGQRHGKGSEEKGQTAHGQPYWKTA